MNTLKELIKRIGAYLFSKADLWSKIRFIKKLEAGSFIHSTVSAQGVEMNGNIKVDENVKLSNTYMKGNICIEGNALVNESTLTGNINIGAYARLMGPLTISGSSKVTIGRNTSLNGPNFDIYAQLNEVHIGNFCSIARNTSFQEFNHFYQRATSYFIHQHVFEDSVDKDIYSKGDIRVGHDVWIGAGCIILSGANIGTGAVIAANSVVAKDIPPYAIVGGNIAKVIKYRFTKDIIDTLLSIEWWHWSHEQLSKNKHLFEGELTIDKLRTVY